MEGTRASDYVELLTNVDLFARLDRVTRAKIAAHLEPLPVGPGDVVFNEGDPGDALYIIASGDFDVVVRSVDGLAQKRINTLCAGDNFGEMALLTGEPRSATIMAFTAGMLLRLDRSSFLSLFKSEPAVALAVVATLSHRLRAADLRLSGGGLRMAMTPPTLDEPAPPPAAPAVPERAETNGSRARRLRHLPSHIGRGAIGGLIAAALLLAAWIVPPPPGLPLAGWHALGTLAALIPLLALTDLPDGAVGLLLAAIWIMGDVAPPKVALGGFAGSSWVLLVCVFALGSALASCGLLYRLGLWAISHARGGFAGQVGALSVAGLALGPAVPNATGRVTLMAPATQELAEALGYQPGSRAATGIAMAVFVGFGQMVAPFLTSSSTALLSFAILPESSRAGLNWLSWIVRAAPAHIVLFLGLVAAIVWMFRPGPAEAPVSSDERWSRLAIQRALLGRPSREEWVAGLVTLGLVFGFVTQPLHHVEPAWIGMLALFALAAARVLTADTLRSVNWSFVLFFGVLTSMAGVFASAKLDSWLAGLVSDAMGPLLSNRLLFVLLFALTCLAVSLVLRWQAAVPILVLALAPLASQAGIDPWVVAIIALVACNWFLLPYQSTIYLALYHGTGGKLFQHYQARRLAWAYAGLTLLAFGVSVPLWHAMGLL